MNDEWMNEASEMFVYFVFGMGLQRKLMLYKALSLRATVTIEPISQDIHPFSSVKLGQINTNCYLISLRKVFEVSSVRPNISPNSMLL